MIRQSAKVLLGVFGGLLLLLLATIGLGYFLNDRAEHKATEFCANIVIASKLTEAVERANGMGIRHYPNQDRQGEVFMFPGWIFNWAECHVESLEGIVHNKWVTEARD